MGTFMPCGITGVLPVIWQRWHSCLCSQLAGTLFTSPARMQGWVTLLARLHTEVVCIYLPKTVTHPNTNQAQLGVTLFMWWVMLPLCQTAICNENGAPVVNYMYRSPTITLAATYFVFLYYLQSFILLPILPLSGWTVNSGICDFVCMYVNAVNEKLRELLTPNLVQI